MHLVTSQKEYQTLVRTAKKEKGASITNCYLFPEAIQRWIDLKRFYVEEVEAGILFLADQKRYYSVYFYLNPQMPLRIPRQDKPQIAQTIYNGQDKNEKQLAADQLLKNAGFIWKDRMQQIKADPEQVLKKIAPLSTRMRKRLTEEGFRFGPITANDLWALDKLLSETPEIPFYDIQFFSGEELEAQAKAGQLEGIFHRNGELCAVHQLFLEGNGAFGWFAVADAYKVEYGMALVLKDMIMSFVIDKGCFLTGWVDDVNIESIRFHRKLGYVFQDKYREHWLLDTENGKQL